MACPGLHCPGCSEGQSAGIAVAVIAALVVADKVSVYVADRIWWIGGTVAACFALAVAASVWLENRTRRREAEYAATRGIWSRADYIAAPRAAAEIPYRQQQHALGFRDLHIHLDGQPTTEQAAVIRQALGR